MVVGVNGSGKTTSIAKLCQIYQQHGRKIILAAADTFRAAAIDQLQIWGERSGVPVIAGAPNSDPGAVVYDAVQAAFNRKGRFVDRRYRRAIAYQAQPDAGVEETA